MSESVFAFCTDACGWFAAVVAVLSFGSFGVPIKSVNVEVNFLVMQSYKTLTCFVTSWLVLLLGEKVQWSNWGIASGLFWVPGAACGIYGIRNAGLAIAVGTWSSIMVLTRYVNRHCVVLFLPSARLSNALNTLPVDSFLFGIIIFEEKVKNFLRTCLAFAFLVVGLIGMSRYSAHVPDNKEGMSALSHRSLPPLGSLGLKRTKSGSSDSNVPLPNTTKLQVVEIEPLIIDDEANIMGGQPLEINTKSRASKDHVVLFGGRLSLTRRQLGVLGAVVNGAWGGMNLIPLHYAMRDDGLTGAGYLVSTHSVVGMLLYYAISCLKPCGDTHWLLTEQTLLVSATTDKLLNGCAHCKYVNLAPAV
jgi:hypothetical protein